MPHTVTQLTLEEFRAKLSRAFVRAESDLRSEVSDVRCFLIAFAEHSPSPTWVVSFTSAPREAAVMVLELTLDAYRHQQVENYPEPEEKP